MVGITGDFKTGTFQGIDFRWELTNSLEFIDAMKRLADATSDFRIPFNLIATDWYRSNKQLFNLSGPGLYAPFGGVTPDEEVSRGFTKKDRAEIGKDRRVGFIFPLLVGDSSRLSKSILSKSHGEAVLDINRTSLKMGTVVPYAIFHQSDKPRRILPQRKIIFITGGPADRSKDSRINGRIERWTSIIDTYINETLEDVRF